MSDKIGAVWARVSTEPQQTLDSQVARSKAELESRGYVVPPERIIKVDWTSMELIACRQFNDLIRWIVNQEIQAVGFLDRDRLQAKAVHRMLFFDECRTHGVEVVVCQGPPLRMDSEGEWMEFGLAKSKEVSVNRAQTGSRDALRERATVKGLPTTCQAPYGYDWDPSRTRLIANDNWENRKLIADLFIQGTTLKGIIKEMGKRGIPSPKGKNYWVEPTLSLILKDTINFGEYRALRRESVIPTQRRRDTYGKTSSKYLPGIPLPNISIEKPIVTRNQHEWIQNKLRQNRLNATRNGKRNYLLRGMIYYEGDNIRYYGHDIRHKSWAYRHSVRSADSDNPRPYLPGRKFEALVEERARHVLTSDEVINSEIAGKDSAINESITLLEKEIKRLEEKREQNVTEESRLANLRIKDTISEEAYERQQGLLISEREWIDKEKEDTVQKLSQLRTASVALIGLEELRERMKEKIYSAEFKDRRFILEALQTRVIVTRTGGIEVEFGIPGNGPTRVSYDLSDPLNACPRY